MGEVVLTIGDMSGGLRTDVDPSLLPSNMTPRCANVIFDGRTVRVRPGRRQHGEAPGEGVLALCEYHNPTMDAENPTRLVVAGADRQVYVSDAEGQQFAPGMVIGRGETPLQVAGTRPRLAQFKESVYLVDGEGPVRKFFGVDTSRWDTTDFGAAYFGASGPAGIALDASDNLYVCDPSNHRVIKFNSAGVAQGWYGESTAAGVGYHAMAVLDCVASTDQRGFNTPMDVAISGSVLAVADTGNNRIQTLGVDGAAGWMASTYGAQGTTLLYAPRAIAIGTDGAVYTGDSNYRDHTPTVSYCRLVRYTADGTWTTQADVISQVNLLASYGVFGLAVNSDTGALYAALRGGYPDGSAYVQASSVVQQYTGGVAPPFFGVSARAAISAPLLPTGITYADAGVYVVFSDRVKIYSTALVEGSSVLRNDCGDLALASTGTWCLTHPAARTVEVSVVTAGADSDYLSLVDEVAPTTAPSIARTTGTLTPAVYEVCYTYVRRTGASGYEESAPSPVTTYTISTESGFTIAVLHDLDAALDVANDHIYIYLRGGIFSTFSRVYDLASPPAAGASESVTITDVEVDSPVLYPYVSRPPAGCSLLMEWQGHMCYGKGDTLYVSQWDDPDRIAPLDLVNDPELYGLWVRIGTDGGAITGFGQIGSYLVVMKRRGVWLVSGEPGTATFSVQQISESNGCIAHETIQQVGGALLVWLDYNRVLAFDGQAFSDIGQYIAPNIRSYTEAEQARAFAVYDPRRRWYMLTVPRLESG